MPDFFQEIQAMPTVKGLYVWGSLARNVKKPNFRVRDIDVLARTRFHSGDLISIDENIIKQNLSDEALENLGYDPIAVAFSKELTKTAKYNFDYWAISADRKLLHWGPILINPQESQEMNKEASEYAEKETGVDRREINKSAEHVRKNWYQSFSKYINLQFEGMPSGWYKTEDIKIKDILKTAVKL